MRVSCNGCRVLRKGCSEKCNIKLCLHWIKSPEAQGNATVFLAKFYGRAGLLNLINAGPDHLRPGTFRSLLYEACGRIVNPTYGATGLLWSGNWHLCQAAVEAVLSGSPISQVSADLGACTISPPLKAYDIRHVSKEENSAGSAAARDLHNVTKTKGRFKRAAARDLHEVRKTKGSFKRAAAKPREGSNDDVDEAARVMWSWCHKGEVVGSPSRAGESSGDADRASVETVEAALVKLEEPAEGSEVKLELTLALGTCSE